MACGVNVPGQALAPISRLMARVWGNGDSMYKDAKVAFTKPKTSTVEAVETAETTAKRRSKEVKIDSTTMIPADLYWTMLRAGDRAKNGGQHRLKSTHRGNDCTILVKSD
mmetsp:Transcript_83044/g.131364  ORF Transcript_83044/g.131364 Transcript_83044/m.131364 type:complete len:110 (-) Transcript_83044:48-377(-)